MATATTVIVAMPNEAKLASNVSSMPAIATRTVTPEMSTERPDVAAAASSAASSAATRGTLFALPLQVEHRVVDSDREPDQEDDRADGVGHRQNLADERDEAKRAEHRRQPQQERDAGRDERPERDQRGSTRVSGTEKRPAFFRSSKNDAWIAFPVLSPNDPT